MKPEPITITIKASTKAFEDVTKAFQSTTNEMNKAMSEIAKQFQKAIDVEMLHGSKRAGKITVPLNMEIEYFSIVGYQWHEDIIE